MNALLWTVLLSMTPIGELRVGLPFAIASGMPILSAYAISVFSNILVVPILFFFLEVVHYRFLHLHTYRSAFDFFMERTRRKAHDKIERFGYLGIFLLVAVPLPLTGAYTAAIAAWFFGMKKTKALIAIAGGVLTAGLIVLSLSVGGMNIVGYFFH